MVGAAAFWDLKLVYDEVTAEKAAEQCDGSRSLCRCLTAPLLGRVRV
jgi:hypothetical protein